MSRLTFKDKQRAPSVRPYMRHAKDYQPLIPGTRGGSERCPELASTLMDLANMADRKVCRPRTLTRLLQPALQHLAESLVQLVV